MIKYYSLSIRSRFCSEVVERILRVVRHRGFELYSVNMLLCEEQNKKQIILFVTVASVKNIFLLYSQLKKLIDVISIEIK